MTETALNEKIDELQENDSRNAHSDRKLAAGCGAAPASEKQTACFG